MYIMSINLAESAGSDEPALPTTDDRVCAAEQ